MTNLINNSVKYTAKGGSITLGIRDYNKDFILCYVKDTGYGIKSEDIPLLFNRFSNIAAQAKAGKKIKSSGLGLSICKGIIEKHGGKIWVESFVDSGSTFFFTLPKKHIFSLDNN